MRGAVAFVLATTLATSAGCRNGMNAAFVNGGIGFGLIATGGVMNKVAASESGDSSGPGPGALVMGFGAMWLVVASVMLVLAAVNEPAPAQPPAARKPK